LAYSHNGLGIVLSETGRLSEAEVEFRTALEVYQKLAGDNWSIPLRRDDVATSSTNLSDALCRLGRPAEARDGFERAIAIREALVREFPNQPPTSATG
jgi:hypothetical protein